MELTRRAIFIVLAVGGLAVGTALVVLAMISVANMKSAVIERDGPRQVVTSWDYFKMMRRYESLTGDGARVGRTLGVAFGGMAINGASFVSLISLLDL